MWQGEVVAGLAGLSGGAIVATALAAFIISLGIVPRYAGITHTAQHLMLYETTFMLGAILGNIFSVYDFPFVLGRVAAGTVGLFSGIFLGSWIIALGEVVNVFAVMARRVGLKKGTGLIVLSIASGKIIGSLMHFFGK